MTVIFLVILLLGLIICAVATALTKRLMTAVIIYSSYSIIMALIWFMLQAPDLAITEAAVGAGITGVLFYLTLRRIDLIDKDFVEKEGQSDDEEND